MKLFRFSALAFALLFPAVLQAEPDKSPPEDKPVAKTPEDAWTQFQKAIEKKERERIWSLVSRASRELLEKEIGAKMKALEGTALAEMAEEIGLTPEEFAKLSEKDLVITRILSAAAKDKNSLLKMKLQNVKVDGDKAEGERDETGEGKKEDMGPAYFLKEDGEWKLDLKRELEEKESEPTDEEPAPEAK